MQEGEGTISKKFFTGIDLQNNRATNAADPSAATDLATKQYVDNVGAGKAWKDPVRAATTTNGALATAYANGQVIDGVTLVTGDPILIKNQTTGADNGIYVVNASGAPTRRSDSNSTGQFKGGTTVYVQEGTANGDKEFSITTDGTITIGSTATTWGQTGGSGTVYTASLGVQLVGGTDFRANLGAGLALSGNAIILDTAIAVRKYATNIGDGSTTAITVTHGLGTLDITASVKVISTGEEVECDVVATSTTVATVSFTTAPASNALRIVIHG